MIAAGVDGCIRRDLFDHVESRIVKLEGEIRRLAILALLAHGRAEFCGPAKIR